MSGIEEILKAAMEASPDRLAEALRLLHGKPAKSEPYLTLRELSRQIGISVSTLRRWRIPHHDLGGTQRYKLGEVEDYLKTDDFRRHQAALRAERRTNTTDHYHERDIQ